ncbi:glutathione S-transferase family protein [Sphingomonas sp. J315]|uniref:glutathione S-transferase family protein n=1 Tax=Sphingomonas sp. J315 TaxID=2898433 RepID=UPI002896F7A6|nr:glutathione S-transferase family protein [Sphingomonas sp. J315]
MTPILHEYAPSGNCYKIRLAAALTGTAIERRSYDIIAGRRGRRRSSPTSTPMGIPVLQLGERFLPESNAATFYLADGTALVPSDPFDRADMLRWMFWEQYNHEPNIATVRFWMGWVGEGNLDDLQRALLPGKRAAGVAALKLMDEHLASRAWFVGDAPSVADICLYAYTHVAEEGGFVLEPFPAVRAWIARVEGLKGYIPITA